MWFRNIRPVHILWQDGIKEEMLNGAIAGIERVLSLAGVHQEITLEKLGQRRQSNWQNQDGTQLNPYQSLDWHIEWARENSKKPGYLNGTAMLNSMLYQQTIHAQQRYELVVVKEPLHLSDDSKRTISGIARRDQGAIISVGHHLHLLKHKFWRNKKRRFLFDLFTHRLMIHEAGHVFGLYNGTGSKDPTDKELKEAHCQNKCVMYWQIDANPGMKMSDQPFCPSCLENLPKHFIVS